MFAVLYFERDPLRLQDLPAGLVYWVQAAGGFAMVGLLLWLAIGWTRMRPADRARIPYWQRQAVFWLTVLAAVSYCLLAPLRLVEIGSYLFGNNLIDERFRSPTADIEVVWSPAVKAFDHWCLFAGGLFALLAVGLPFLKNLAALRPRRILALAILSFKEAVRRRVLWAFSFILLLFLFGSWFLQSKPEDQLRLYVKAVYWAMTLLLLITGALVASFSLPADIKQQTIHTVLTKPVERFEVYLGRVLGFSALMTLVLVVMTLVSLLYVLRGIDPDAAAESLKARAPLYGDLSFENIGGEARAEKGENVGEEWGYRSYITAPLRSEPPQTAVWSFASAPRELAGRKKVRCEFTLAIYRTTKVAPGAHENEGINCKFIFQTWRFDPTEQNIQKYKDLRADYRKQGMKEDDINEKLAKEMGYYEIDSYPVTSFHTLYRDIPGGLFENANQDDPARRAQLSGARLPTPPPLEVKVRCLSLTQYVGMAKYDLYLRQDNPDPGAEPTWFSANFCKGAVGLWMRLVFVVGVATALSTYLSNVLSLLVTLFLYVGGLCRNFILSVINNTNVGGGPMRSFLSLVGRQIGTGSAAAPPREVYKNSWFVLMQIDTANLNETPYGRTSVYVDPSFRWFMARVFDVIPDIDRFDLTAFVAEGFDVAWGQLGVTLLLLVGYLLPWAVLAYYLLKWREVASAT
jgi:ABC-type transport system involved in multi-copper enzyme maturation permease subunit